MIRKGIQTTANAVGAITTTTTNIGTLAITGGATVTIASDIGASASPKPDWKASTNSTFSSDIYAQSISLDGESTGLNDNDAEKADSDDRDVYPVYIGGGTTIDELGTDSIRVDSVIIPDGANPIFSKSFFAKKLAVEGSGSATFYGKVSITDGLFLDNGVLNFGPDSIVNLSGANILVSGTGRMNFYGVVDITGVDLSMFADKIHFYGQTIGKVVEVAEASAADAPLDNDGSLETAANAAGTTNASGALMMTGKIGATNSLKGFNVGADSKVITLNDDAKIATFNFGGNASSSLLIVGAGTSGDPLQNDEGKAVEEALNNGRDSEISLVESIEEDNDATLPPSSEIAMDDISRDIHLSPGVVKLAEEIDVTGVIDNSSSSTGYLEFYPSLRLPSEVSPAAANNDGILETAGAEGTLGITGSAAALTSISMGVSGKTSTFSSTVKATTITIGAGTAVFSDNITGALVIGTTGGTITIADGKSVTGAITNTSGGAIHFNNPKTGDVMYAGAGHYYNYDNDAALITTAEDVIKETDVVLGGLDGVDHVDGV